MRKILLTARRPPITTTMQAVSSSSSPSSSRIAIVVRSTEENATDFPDEMDKVYWSARPIHGQDRVHRLQHAGSLGVCVFVCVCLCVCSPRRATVMGASRDEVEAAWRQNTEPLRANQFVRDVVAIVGQSCPFSSCRWESGARSWLARSLE